MKTTGRETDFALQDPHSFFVLQSPEGERVLTRAGDFQFDSQGMLVDQSGQRVLGSDGKSIQLNPSLPYAVGAEGRISQGENVWELMVGKPKSMGDVSHLGGNQFKPLADFDLVPRSQRRVLAGVLEQSAVSPTGAMMELIETSRVYEANVRMIQSQDSVMGTLIGRILK
jgi:flagellar basal body rod protein FlgG